MRLVRVHIQRFRCLDDLVLDLDDVVVLVGANSTGKSSVLHALDWFFSGRALDPEDIGGLEEGAAISVDATFADFSAADADAFGSYVAHGEMTLSRTWSLSDGEKLTGRAMAFPAFEIVRVQPNKSDVIGAYKGLQASDAELGLPAIRSADAPLEAMLAWEREHPDDLETSTVSATHLFGFAGQGKLAGRFDYVLIPAASDLQSETRDVRGTLLRQIVDRAGPNSESMRQRLQQLGEDLTAQIETIVAEEGLETFKTVSALVTEELARLIPAGTVSLEARLPTVRIPEIGFAMRVADGGIETDLGRQGHGFQRALFIALVRQLARTEAEGDPPGLFIALEEPELYQHPVQARHFSHTLATLARSGEGAIQVAYATHSEHFIDETRFERIRRFRKRVAARSWPTAEATQATGARVAQRLAGVVDPDQVALRVRITLRRQLAEAVFANAVLLVEGRSDAGFLHGLADRGGGLDAAGVAVVAVMGKHQILLPFAILEELGVPTYVIFDGDADLETRMAGRGKAAADSVKSLNDSRSQNRQILCALGSSPEDQPESQVHDRFAVLRDSLEAEFSSWPQFTDRLAELQTQDGDWRGKSEDAYRQAAADAAGDAPQLFSELLQAVLRLATTSV